MLYLKERLIEFIKKKPRCFKQPLADYGGYQYMDWTRDVDPLLPIYDFAGAILYVAGYSLQLSDDGIRLPLNAPWLDKEWVEYEQEYGCASIIDVPALARQLWARDYGDEEAYKLPFYASPVRHDGKKVLTLYWDDGRIPNEHITYFLGGEHPYTLNFCDKPDVKPKWKR